MARTCTICAHPARDAIERAYLDGGTACRLAAQYGVSDRALRRHCAAHLPSAIVKAKKAADVARGDELLARINVLEDDARRLGAKAERDGDLRTALAAVRELVRIVDVLARLRVEIPPEPEPETVYDWSRISDPEKLRTVRDILMEVLVRPGDPPPRLPWLELPGRSRSP
jgi:transposase-like protein